MTDHRSPKDIERELEQQREGLADSLDDLKDKVSVETMLREAATQIREHSGEIGHSVTRAVKQNPLGVALTGIGLAWLIFGERRSPSPRRDDAAAARTTDARDSRHDSDAPSWARMTAAMGADDSDDSPAERARDGLKDSATALRDRGADLRARLSEGTEQLSEEGRARVLAAREKAYEARATLRAGMAETRDKAAELFTEQPLIVGGLALAVGAAIGAALPQTRIEQDHFGDTADELLQEAERIYAEERAKLGAVAQKAAKDMGEVVEKAASDAVDTVRPAEDGTGPDHGSGKAANQAGKSAQQDADMPPSGPRKATPGDIPS
jgi:hypothetical protein